MGDFLICTADAVDASLISALCQKTIRQSNAVDYSADEINAVCEDFSVEKVLNCMQRRHVVVLKHQDQIAGTVSLEKDKLHSLFVSPKFQGFGYGAILVEYIEGYAGKSGVASMCVSSSITAQGFYKRLGYQVEGRNTHPNGATYFMTKVL